MLSRQVFRLFQVPPSGTQLSPQETMPLSLLLIMLRHFMYLIIILDYRKYLSIHSTAYYIYNHKVFIGNPLILLQ